ncbi:MAG: hypothetical protein KAR44_08265 [Candidatus Aegiribacteria sp.]|nr:hypothetical protein [Candidatus Aegiribacteria sp.]
MYNKILTSIPQIRNQTSKNDAIEWEIPQQVSVALAFIDKCGYTVIAKVRIDKKHWWNRPWKTFITHAPSPAEAIKNGLEFLESYGYTIDYNTDQFEEMIGNPDNS